MELRDLPEPDFRSSLTNGVQADYTISGGVISSFSLAGSSSRTDNFRVSINRHLLGGDGIDPG
jgi:hypothetical protein